MTCGVLSVVITNGECNINRQRMNYYPFFFLYYFVSLVSTGRRNHIEVVRPFGETRLELSGLATRDVTSWTTGDDLSVVLASHTIVDIIPDTSNPNMYDIYVDNIFTYACSLTCSNSAGVVLYIIRDKNKLRIAPSPNSICVPAWTIEATTPEGCLKHRTTPLRVNLLRKLASRYAQNSQTLDEDTKNIK